MSEETAVARLENYAIMEHGISSVMDVIQENIGETELTPRDLERIQIPTGGRKKWEVPTLAGEETVETLQGVIIYWRSPRAYWATPFEESGGGSVPDCYSDDGKTGQAQEEAELKWAGGIRECRTCPLNDWGSAPGENKGKACKEMRLLFLLREDSLLPATLTLPPTSIQASKKYFLRLASRGIPYHGVLTNITLEVVQSASGIKYSEARFSLEKQLALEQAQFIEDYRNTIRAQLDSVTVEHEDVAAEEGA